MNLTIYNISVFITIFSDKCSLFRTILNDSIILLAPRWFFNDLLQYTVNIHFKENSLELNLMIPLISIIKSEMCSQQREKCFELKQFSEKVVVHLVQ